ncbi:hypothetical protein CLW00_11061 [Mongoliibacter ruber]|uniref:Uncharacterized protein n=1 Tax=Mongoliibacter ruber TaxID=1750599 RepID=A0A2T0WGT9_9BACT|nr:hypothetical protein CLW00_11061 [Mongoliibacter ruber]
MVYNADLLIHTLKIVFCLRILKYKGLQIKNQLHFRQLNSSYTNYIFEYMAAYCYFFL